MNRRKFMQTTAAAVLAQTLSGCQTSATTKISTPAGQMETASQPGKTVQATSTAEVTASTAGAATEARPQSVQSMDAFILNRLAFGPRPGETDLFEASTSADPAARLSAFLDSQLEPETIDDAEFESRYTMAGFETLAKSLTELGYDHIVHNPYGDNDDRHWQWYVKPLEELVRAIYLRAVYSRRQLQELMADFWHNHFNVYGWQDDAAPLFVSYDRDVIRKHLFGNFREFLEAVASHPAMLAYLNNRTNSDAGPNENFARELLELHTLGAENYAGVVDPASIEKDENGIAKKYCDNDVYETARCFTGWRVADDLWDGEADVGDSLEFIYYRPWHDRFNKFILGQYIPADQSDQADARRVMDLLAGHYGTARYIARKLCRRFVTDEPDESLIERIAQVFHENGNQPDQLKRVYRALFESPEFLSSQGQKLKRPFELAVSALRAINADFSKISADVVGVADRMGQPIFGHHQPNGYPDTREDWLNTMTNLFFWNLVTGLVENWWEQSEDGGRIHVDLGGQTPAGFTTAAEIIQYWQKRLLLDGMEADDIRLIAGQLAGEAGIDVPLAAEDISARVSGAVALLIMSPEFRYRG